jgi:hypothetical protein
MSVFVYFVFVPLWADPLAQGAVPTLCKFKKLKKLKGQGPTKGCRADNNNSIQFVFIYVQT